LAVFSEFESRRLGQFFNALRESGVRFPDFDAPWDAGSDEWDRRVRERVSSFARLRDLWLPNLRTITFIG